MIRSAVISILFISLAVKSNGQIDLSGIKNKAKELGVSDKVGNLLTTQMEKSRKEYDEASFNYAVSLQDNAGLFESEERYKKNQKLLYQAYKAGENKEITALEKASDYNEVGEMMYASNKFKTAENSFNEAIKIFLNENDTLSPTYALTLSNLGLLYHTTGRYIQSENFTKKALDIRKSVMDKSAPYASSVNNLAVLYKDMGRYNESEQLISDAISLNENSVGKSSVPYALSLNNQAMLFQAMGRDAQAESILKQALEIADKTLKEKSTNYVRLMMNLALLYQDMGKYNDAETLYLKALKIKEGKLGTNHPDYAHLLNELASLYMVMGKPEKVEELLKKSINIYKKNFGENHPSYANAISNLGNFYRVSSRISDAEPLLKQGLGIRKETLGENHPDYINSLENLGLLYWQKGNLPEASSLLKQVQNKNIEMINTYFAPLSEAEKTKLWDKIRPKFQRFNSFVASAMSSDPSLAGDMYNYHLSTKALLLNSTNKVKQQILNGTDKDLKQEYLAWLDEKEHLSRLYTLSKVELAEEKINLDSIEKATNAREKALSAKSKIFSQEYKKEMITFKDVMKNLTPEEAAIEIIHFHKFDKISTDTVNYAALILTKESLSGPQLVLLDNGNQLEKRYYNYYKNAINQKLKDEYSYDQYWARIEKAIPGKQTIYLSLDGIYNQINLNTLLSPQGFYVLDKKNLEIITNTKEIIRLKNDKGATVNNNAVLIGFPDYGTKGTVEKLPGTKVELDNIKKLLTVSRYSVKELTGQEASEEKIKTLKSPKILHIATHGFFLPESDNNEDEEKVFGIASGKANENPLFRSGLLLSGAENAMEGANNGNGILTAYEAMNLLLDNTEIVILSACQTGLGDVKNGEGVYGLQRAFQVAGAKSIIMSLWKVNDEATQQLMSSFYKNYALTNNKLSAFKKAQIELKAKFKDPYYWGAFVMVE
jgi:CHAT domain-containing protein/Flp pilus assembly protein TadD